MRKVLKDLAIIIIGDSEFCRELQQRITNMDNSGNIRVAGNTQDLQFLLSQYSADIILINWATAELDGLQLTGKVRQFDEENNHYTYIIMLTSQDPVGEVIDAFDRGVDDYLHNEPEPQELAARLYTAGRIAALQNGLLDTVEKLRQDNAKRVTIDALTGFGNRLDAERRFDELLKLVVTRGGAVCCGFIHITDADELLEQHGIDAYSSLLESIGKRLRRMVRPGDIMARLSNHEFVVGTYYLDEQHVRVRNYERIMEGINLRPIKVGDDFITINVVMAMCCNREGQTIIPAKVLIEYAAEKIPESITTGEIEVAD